MAQETEATREELRSKRISTEEMVRLQLDRINTIRSEVRNPDRIVAWSEALEALHDLLLPWSSEPDERLLFMQEWAERPVAVIKMTLPNGTVQQVPVPTAQDCRAAQQILMRLLDRKGLLVKRRTVSGPGPRVFENPTPPQKAAEDGRGRLAADEPAPDDGDLEGVAAEP